MHGRLKVRTTDEENERKKKERAKKVAVYRAETEKVFNKRKNGELDEEGLQLSGQLLMANPDIYTLWNFRKEILLHLKDNLNEENMKRIADDELYLTEVCLKSNPKSYGSWHHRCWVLEKMPFTSWTKEVAVCNKYLDLDERNFHVWDYRRFVVSKAEIPSTEELDYTTEKINTNFSNYSAWHYRSKLLPIVHPDSHSIRPVEETTHKSELEMVESAAFTDPYDQSAWFYLRWLLGRIKPELSVCQAITYNDVILVSFNQPTSIGTIEIDSNATLSSWRSISDERGSRVFVSKINKQCLVGDQELSVEIKSKITGNVVQKVILNNVSDEISVFNKPMDFEVKFSSGLTAVLNQQLESCTQLLEFEPDSKWALLTSVYLMQAINRKEFKEQTMNLLNKLMIVDSQRTAYYSDLKSRYQMEYLLEERGANFLVTDFIASNCQLTALYHTEYLMAVQVVDLSNNSLENRSLPLLCYLQLCKVLNLDKNKITTLKNFPALPYLETLSCTNNRINTIEGLDGIANCKKLVSLDLCNNCISKNDALQEVTERLLAAGLKDLKIQYQ